MANKYIRFGADLFNNGDKTFYLGESNKRWNDVFAEQVTSTKYRVTDGAATPVVKVTLQWNATDQSLDFIFA